MPNITRRAFAASSAAVAATAGLGLKPGFAQAYPARPVTVIVDNDKPTAARPGKLVRGMQQPR